MNIIVSACLLGTNCKYSGGNNLNEKLVEFVKGHNVIPVCPEELGGLPTPREPNEIQGGSGEEVLNGEAKVTDKNGKDVTEQFVKGAKEVLKLAQQHSCSAAILKANSPSCGCGTIYDGSFSGRRKEGSGVCAQLLLDKGIKVMTDENFEEKLRELAK